MEAQARYLLLYCMFYSLQRGYMLIKRFNFSSIFLWMFFLPMYFVQTTQAEKITIAKGEAKPAEATPKESTETKGILKSNSTDGDLALALSKIEEKNRKDKKEAFDKYQTDLKDYKKQCLGKKKESSETCSTLLDDLNQKKKALEFNFGQKIDDNSDNKVCDDKYDDYNTNYKDCRPAYEKMSDKCNGKGDAEIIDSDTLNMVSPLLSGVKGADTMLEVYSAMNDKPGCYLSKSDFMEQKGSLKDEVRDLEEQLRTNIKEGQTAQEEFKDNMKEWADEEIQILDDLNKMPIEREKKVKELDKMKTKAKIESQSKYNTINDEILKTKRAYNELVDSQTVAMVDTSEFALHDKCLNSLAEIDAKKNKNGTPAAPAVSKSFSGAFLLGKNADVFKQKSYDLCMSRERKNAVRISRQIINELNSMKQKLVTYDRVIGQIDEELKILDKDVTDEIKSFDSSQNAEKANKKLRYLKIQDDKKNAMAELVSKLKSLDDDTKNIEKKISIAKLKLQHFTNKTAPTDSDKSVTEQIEACEDFPDFKDSFYDKCCNNDYQGSGAKLCKSFEKTTRKGKSEKPSKTSGSSKSKSSQ